MSVAMNLVSGVGTLGGDAPALPGTGSATFAKDAPSTTPFGNLLTSSVNEVDQLESQARSAVEGLLTGTGVDVHQAMIATEKADMAFEMALSVRNKAVQAYQQVMQMQF